jgi:hypothetical protein
MRTALKSNIPSANVQWAFLVEATADDETGSTVLEELIALKGT